MTNYRTLFKAPWDLLLIVITVGIVTLLLGLDYMIVSSLVTFINWGIIIGCAAFGIYGYSIQDGFLKIVRLGWSKNVAIDSIKSIETKSLAMMGSIRIFGIGGVFGYIGNFKNSVLGHYKAYVTHRQKTVLITTADEKQILVSPDDPEAFINSLQREMKSVSKGKIGEVA